MKTCPACGLHVEDGYLYCWEDGMRLSGGDTLTLPQRPTSPMATQEVESPFLQAEQSVEEQRVLSCPVCGGEFPLTFSACPVHDLPLTSKRVSRLKAPAHAAIAVVEEPISEVVVSDEAVMPAEPAEDELHFAEEVPITEPEPEAAIITSGLRTAGTRGDEIRERFLALWRRVRGHDRQDGVRRRSMNLGFGLGAPFESPHPRPPLGMRVAARITAIALGLFAIAALYVFYRQVTRAPSRSARTASIQNRAEQMASPLVATPSEAREYSEEPAPIVQPPPDQVPPVSSTGKPERTPGVAADVAPRINVPPPSRATPAVQPAQVPDAAPVPTPGRFDAQLVRVRSYKAASGYSYSLTFTLSEHAGRPMKWERLSVVTHSASGATHTEMLGFQHWLAGSGAFTFTVNVDMVGASEADWRGRISCMSVGADENGRPLRASFGANVAP